VEFFFSNFRAFKVYCSSSNICFWMRYIHDIDTVISQIKKKPFKYKITPTRVYIVIDTWCLLLIPVKWWNTKCMKSAFNTYDFHRENSSGNVQKLVVAGY
jgi:hypothetical protein